ncbi:MAG TPA: hypothetical protein VLC92_10215 [Rhodocyclaceae bacterium]|nr:hypothetical protein [Rhodocyclaceae bacterium]
MSHEQSFGIPDYLRYRVPGGTYFFAITLLERGGDLLVRHIDALREAVRRTRAKRPFHIDAWVTRRAGSRSNPPSSVTKGGGLSLQTTRMSSWKNGSDWPYGPRRVRTLHVRALMFSTAD